MSSDVVLYGANHNYTHYIMQNTLRISAIFLFALLCIGKAYGQSFSIFLTCVKKVDECTKLATFGYSNQTGSAFTIAHGINNNLSGGTIIRGQSITQFSQGTYENAFKIRYTCTDNIIWTVSGIFGTQTVSSIDAFDVECLDAIHVFVKCIANDGCGNFRVTFGYENTGSDTVVITNPLQNFLTGNILSGNVITAFAPGKHEFAFDIGYAGDELKWTLTGYDEYSRSATAYSMHAGKCFEPLNVFVKCIRHNSNGTTTAVFGYENINPWGVYLAGFPVNYLVYEDAGQLPENTFYSGKYDSAFSATFSGAEMKWALTGPDGVQRFAVASDAWCRNCDSVYYNNTNEKTYIVTPNPAQDIISVSAKEAGLNNNAEVVFFDASGRNVPVNSVTAGGAIRIDISKMQRGFYIVAINDGGILKRIPVFKQ